jgi:hypothetical protein
MQAQLASQVKQVEGRLCFIGSSNSAYELVHRGLAHDAKLRRLGRNRFQYALTRSGAAQYRRIKPKLTDKQPRMVARKRPESVSVPLERARVEGYHRTTKAQVERAQKREALLVAAYAKYLRAQGDTINARKILPIGTGSPIYADIYNESRRQLIEAKASNTREDIRMAIGQLADYRRGLSPQITRAVLTGKRPNDDLLELLSRERITAIWREGSRFADTADGAFT